MIILKIKFYLVTKYSFYLTIQIFYDYNFFFKIYLFIIFFHLKILIRLIYIIMNDFIFNFLNLQQDFYFNLFIYSLIIYQNIILISKSLPFLNLNKKNLINCMYVLNS